MKLKRVLLFFTDKDKRWLYLNAKGFYKCLSDEEYNSKRYLHTLGRELDINNPQRFNEKLQWLKLNDRKEEYKKFVDKIEVKNIVGKIIGKKYIIPTIAVYDSVEDIDYSVLPKQYVIKCNHDSGTVYIHKDGKVNVKKIKAIKKRLKIDYYWVGREWPYKDMNRKILIEEFIGDAIYDYKVFLFNGQAYCIQVDYDRLTNHHRNFYDLEWKYIEFTTRYPTNAGQKIEKPKCLKELLELSGKIANYLNNPPFLRADFYIIQNQIYFGEVTFYHGSGFEQFYPDEWDYKLGDLIKLEGA